MDRRSFLHSATALAATAWIGGSSRAQERPGLLVILADDLQHTAVGYAANPVVQTPHLDRLAARGTWFSHCYCSNPICTPSRAAILTGRYGFGNGVTFFGERLREGLPTFADLLASAGYLTGYAGKWHNSGRPQHHGFRHTRHVFQGGMHNYESIPVSSGDGPRELIERNPTEVFADGAIELLQGPLAAGPFCQFLSFTAPHDPRTPPARYEALYPPDQMPLPANFRPAPRFDPGTLAIRDEKLLPRPLDPAAVRQEISRYYGLVTQMDEQIGRVLATLEQQGRLDQTLIVFAGDHGLALGAQGLLGKQTMHEEGVRTPLLLAGPGVAAGQRCDALVDLMDIMPTLCRAGGTAAPPESDGRDLLAVATGGAQRELVFAHYHHLFRMVRDRRHKLILHLRDGRRELFDLVSDPHEQHDLAGQPATAAVEQRLAEALAQWRRAQGDPQLADG